MAQFFKTTKCVLFQMFNEIKDTCYETNEEQTPSELSTPIFTLLKVLFLIPKA